MDIKSFVKYKHEVIFVYDDDTVQHAIDILKRERFTSIPILSRDGEYYGTLTEGDLLYTIYESGIKWASNLKISEIDRNRDYKAVMITDPVITLIVRASDENFVPIVDENNKFLGIVTRKKLLDYFFETKFVIL